ncbi:hypothetical protein [Actinacidiphila sp. bgisy160]|uniref:hypothetical protein n=1 Tax=Actinacidiphila sp. bgisy160 TaxID=3413796 RepID=UPI003D71E4A5
MPKLILFSAVQAFVAFLFIGFYVELRVEFGDYAHQFIETAAFLLAVAWTSAMFQLRKAGQLKFTRQLRVPKEPAGEKPSNDA